MIRLSNLNQTVVEVCRDLFASGNHTPTKAEITKTMFGSSTTYTESLIGRALYRVPDYFREEGNECVIPVSRHLYDDVDLGGLGRKAPNNMEDAIKCLAVFGRTIAGLAHVTGNGTKGYHLLFVAYEGFWRKNAMMAEQNNKAKVERFEAKGWLKPGEISTLAIADLNQLLLS